MDFSGRQSSQNITKPAGKSTGKSDRVGQKVQWTAAESPMESPTDSSGKSNGAQQTMSRPAYLLLLIKNQTWMNKPNNALN